MRRGRGVRQPRTSNISEAERISIKDRLESFRSSSDEVLTFEPNLSNADRAIVHRLALKMGFKSKSSGKGSSRCVSVYKKRTSNEGQSQVASLTFSPQTREVFTELFSRHPPKIEEFSKEEEEVAVPSKKQQGSGYINPLNESQITKEVEMLATRLKKSASLQQIVEKRSKLPIATFKDSITSAIDSHKVVVIAGETGCGKTTQVPQYILDHMWSQRKSCRILCSQPRRISATSVAERVASERGENIGGTVGYQIRMESKGGKHSSIMFCTNGVLLRKLIASGSPLTESMAGKKKRKAFKTSLLDATHIIVDEIHERDRYADFLLIILRDLLKVQPNLRLILMSATIDAELFSKYFDDCPVIRVPGFIYPVQTYYLEDILKLLENGESISSNESSSMNVENFAAMDEALNIAFSDDNFDTLMEMIADSPHLEIYNYQHSESGVTPLMVAAAKGKFDEVSLLLDLGANFLQKDQDGKTALDWAQKENQEEVAELISKQMEVSVQMQSEVEEQLLKKYVSNTDEDEVNVQLIVNLLKKICENSSSSLSQQGQGAVLIFLPGWEEITRCRDQLLKSPHFKDSSKYIILPLHSLIASSEQKKVFRHPPPGVRKIILATNIAETSVTIDDITVVIDSGFMKEKSYDPYRNVSTLHISWISKASARQREGRAGRCQPGVCYHLFSKVRAAALPEYQIPEIKRASLEELCLQIKLLHGDCSISDFMKKAIDPPLELSVRNAIILLQEIGAMNHEEKLTDLGRQLGSLPIHPTTSKMLLFAILMNCLDPALTIACASSYKDPFILPVMPQERKKAIAAKQEFIWTHGGYSDQLAVVAAFNSWREAKNRGKFCANYYISNATMFMIDGMRHQLWGELRQKGLVPEHLRSCSLNSQDSGILRAVLLAGFYPMVGTMLPALPSGRKAVVLTSRGEKVRVHPHSTLFKLVHFNRSQKPSSKNHLLAFDEIMRTDASTSIKSCTLVQPYALLLLATEMVVAPLEEDEDDDSDSGSEEMQESDVSKSLPEKTMSIPDNVVSMVVDRWLRFEATSLDAAQLYCLRERLSAAMTFKVKHPHEPLPPLLGESVYAIACLLSYDGNVDFKMPSDMDHREFHSQVPTAPNTPGRMGGSTPRSKQIADSSFSSNTAKGPIKNNHQTDVPKANGANAIQQNVVTQVNIKKKYVPVRTPN